MSSAQFDIIKGRLHLMQSNEKNILGIAELIFRVIFLPFQIIALSPLLWILYCLEIAPKNFRPQKNKQNKKLFYLFLSLPIIIPWLLFTIFSIDIMVLIIDYALYKIECEEFYFSKKDASKAREKAPSKGVHHAFQTWFDSRYVQSLLYSPFYNMRNSKLLSFAVINDKKYIKNSLPKRKQISKVLTLKGRPNRQFNERIDANSKQMNDLFGKELFGELENIICPTPSFFEGLGANAAKFNDLSKCSCIMKSKHGEFCHIHTFDGSWHCMLSPMDAIQVVENGWGEIWCNYLIYPHLYKAPYILIFAARNDDDLTVLKQILTASYQFCLDQSNDPETS